MTDQVRHLKAQVAGVPDDVGVTFVTFAVLATTQAGADDAARQFRYSHGLDSLIRGIETAHDSDDAEIILLAVGTGA